jgi:hypothetical protein
MAGAGPAAGRTVELNELAASVRAWCAGADPALLTGAQAASVAEDLAGVQRQLVAKQAAMAARAAECNAYSGRAGSAEEWLARQNGVSRSEAKRAIDTARRLRSCPVAVEAFERGELSLAEADVVSSASVVDPSAEVSLVARATSTHDLAGVRDASDKVRRAARSGEDEGARLARLRAGRRWREFTDADGHRGVDARFVPEDFAAVMPVIDAFTDSQFEAARRAGARDGHEAYRADGVLAALAAAGATIGLTGSPATSADSIETIETAETGETAGPPAALGAAVPDRIRWTMCVVVDGIALKRGYAAAGETCEIPGIGPVSVAWARTLMDDALVDLLVHDSYDIRAYASSTRHRPRAVDLGLLVRDRACMVPGCRKQWRLEADHCHDFAKGGPMALDNADRLCTDHHDEKTHRGARYEITDTERLWWPPPPPPGAPPPPEGAIPWRAPLGEHLGRWSLDDLPGRAPPRRSADDESGPSATDPPLPFA